MRECGVLLVEHNTQVAGVVEEHLFTPDEPVSRNRTRRPVLGWRYSGAAGEPEQPRASARQRVQGSYEGFLLPSIVLASTCLVPL